jgi:hypothetical protein
MTPYKITCLRNQVHIVGPTIRRLRQVVAHHYTHRHDGRGSKAVKSWIEELRRVDRASGYSNALAMLAAYDSETDDDHGLSAADRAQFYGPSAR